MGEIQTDIIQSIIKLISKADAGKIIGAENAIDDPKVLDEYSKDHSFVPLRKPLLVVKVSKAKLMAMGVVKMPIPKDAYKELEDAVGAGERFPRSSE